MEKTSEEFVRRTGHRFNHIIISLPTVASSAMPIEEILDKVKKIGYNESTDQLLIDLEALTKRKEVGKTFSCGIAHYWALPKGEMEVRKRRLLIRLHDMELTEEGIATLEKLVHR